MRCPKSRFPIQIIVFDELELIIFVSQGLTLLTASIVIIIIIKHRTKRITGCGREPLGRQRHIIETKSESVSLRPLPRWKKEADIEVTRPPGIVCSDFTPLYSSPKAPRIKSIEISINETGNKSEEMGKVARKDNTASQEEDMFEDKEVTQIQNLFVKLRSSSRPGKVHVRSSSKVKISDLGPS